MKKTMGVVMGVSVLTFAAVGAWYLARTSASEAEADAMDQRHKDAKLAPVKFVVRVPNETPADQTLYLSGSAPTMGNWQAKGVPLERQPDGTFATTVELMTGVEYAFKVNRGNWGTVERGPNVAEMDNRTLSCDGKPVEVVVASWLDEGKGNPQRITLTGTIDVHDDFKSALLGHPRDVVVYLPPGYDPSEDRRYPVLYLQDGQNLFDQSTSFKLIEWQVDETAQRLVQSNRIQPPIIVGVYNTEWRNAEYTPPGMNTNDPKSNPQPKGDAYGRFLVEELKPFVDQRYRTRPDRAHTGVGGSAMGGLIAAHVAKAHKDTFGFVALCSPWLRAPDGNARLMPGYAEGGWIKGTRWYLDVGTAGGGAGYPPFSAHGQAADPQAVQNALADTRELVAAFDSAGLAKGADYFFEEVQGGTFDEPGWQKRVEPMLTFLFKPAAASGTAPATQPSARAN